MVLLTLAENYLQRAIRQASDKAVKQSFDPVKESNFYERIFSRLASKRKDFWNDVSVTLVVSTVDTESEDVISVWNAFVTKDRQLFVEAPEVLTPPSKDTLICLLELAEELGCLQAFVCVNKQYTHFRELIRTFTYLGFALVNPREQTKLFGVKGAVALLELLQQFDTLK
eukprot:jgi/Galph1/1321/GphlegSOOS_G5994.1